MHSSEPDPEALQLSEECRKLSGNVSLVSSLIFNLALLVAPQMVATYINWPAVVLAARLHQPQCFLLGRQPPIRGEVIDELRQMLAELGK